MFTAASLVLAAGACRSADPVSLAAPPVGSSAVLSQSSGTESAAAGSSRCVYSQVNTSARQAKANEFVQIDTPSGRLAGTLIGRAEFPVSQYLDPDSRGRDRPELNWPPHRRAEAFFVSFDPPMEEWPPGSGEERVSEQRAKLVAYDSYGVPFTEGRARRRVWHEEYETVQTPAGTFENCSRLRSDTELRFGWWAGMHLYETAWLSADGLVVRRMERITGHAMVILRFDSTHRYDLQSLESIPIAARLVETASEVNHAAAPASPRWARLAIHLERAASRPRVAGLAIDWDVVPSDQNAPSLPPHAGAIP